MAITYHAGRRIQGLSTELDPSNSLYDDFTSSGSTSHTADNTTVGGWTTSNYLKCKVNGTDDRLDLNLSAVSGELTGAVYDLQQILGSGNYVSTQFILRFKYHINTSVDSNQHACYFGLSSANQTAYYNTAQDYIGVTLSDQVAGNSVYVRYGNNDTWTGSNYGNINSTPTWTSNTDYWFEIKNDGTNITMKIFSDEYVTQIGSTSTVANGFTGNLRYIKFVTYNGGTGGTHDVYVDDLYFYDNTSTIPSGYKPTNVQSGSRFEETDTQKIYYWNGSTWTEEV